MVLLRYYELTMRLLLHNLNFIDKEGILQRDYSILIIDGIIKSIKKNDKKVNAIKKIDLDGLLITPGFIDTHSHIGIIKKFDMLYKNFHNNKVLEILDFKEEGFLKAVRQGNLYSHILPGSRYVVNGYGCVINNFTKKIIKRKAGFKIAIGDVPKYCFYKKHEKIYTRKMQFRDLEYFLQNIKKANIHFRCHVHKKNDISNVIKLFKKYNLPLIIDHATESYMLLDDIKINNVMISYGPIFDRNSYETKNFKFETPFLIFRQGIIMGFQTDHDVYSGYKLKNIALVYIKLGRLSSKNAFKALTINGAAISEIGKKYGSIEINKIAEFLIWDSDPLSNSKTKTKKIFINNKLIDL